MDMVAEQRVNASSGDVFDAMADGRNERRWNSQVTRSDLLSGEPIGEGSRFEIVNRGQAYAATISRYQPPTELSFAVTGKQMDIIVNFVVRPDGDGSGIRGMYDFRPKGFMKLLLPLLGGSIRKDMPNQMGSFARMVEQQAGKDAVD